MRFKSEVLDDSRLKNRHHLLIVLTLSALVGIPLLSYSLQSSFPLLAQENGVLESTQIGLIVLACVTHFLYSRRVSKSSLTFVIHLGLALLTYSFALRELEIARFGHSPYWILLEKSLRVIRTVLWFGFFALIYTRFRVLIRCWKSLIKQPVVWVTIAGGIFLIIGGLFDRRVFSSMSQGSSQFAEEVMELNGYLLICIASFLKSRQSIIGLPATTDKDVE